MKIALVKVENTDGFPFSWYGQKIGQVFTVEPETRQFNEHAYPVSMLRVIGGDHDGDYIFPAHVSTIKEISARGAKC